MAQLIFILSLLSCAIFFYLVGTRPLSVVCLLAIVLFIAVGSNGFKSTSNKKIDFGRLASENALLIARILLMTGIGTFLFYMDFTLKQIALYFILTNIGLFITSHLTDYSDGKKVFHISYFVSLFFLFFVFFGQITISDGIFVLASLIPFHFAMYTFIIFVVGIIHKPSEVVLDYSYLLFHLSVLIAIFFNKDNITLYNIVVAQLYLVMVYYINLYIKKLQAKQIKTNKNITAEEILQGKTIFETNKFHRSDIYYDIIYSYHKLLENISSFSHEILYFANTLVIVFMIWFYIKSIFINSPTTIDQIFYRFCMILFFINFLIIKKDNPRMIFLHKFVAFAMVNFAIYVNIIYLLGTAKIDIIVIITVLRNYMNAILISQSKNLFKNLFVRQDYRYRIGANVLSLIANIVLLIKTSMPSQLIFAIVCVYIGSFGFLTYYNINFVYNEVLE